MRASHDDDRERSLSIGSDAGGKCGRQQSQAGHQSGHHDGAKSQERGLPRSRVDIHSLRPQLVDVGNENDGCLD
jgi:hypothetical protein